MCARVESSSRAATSAEVSSDAPVPSVLTRAAKASSSARMPHCEQRTSSACNDSAGRHAAPRSNVRAAAVATSARRSLHQRVSTGNIRIPGHTLRSRTCLGSRSQELPRSASGPRCSVQLSAQPQLSKQPYPGQDLELLLQWQAPLRHLPLLPAHPPVLPPLHHPHRPINPLQPFSPHISQRRTSDNPSLQ